MIRFEGTEGDIITIEHAEEVNLRFSRIKRGYCLVEPCYLGDHLYGYNFCERHQWILPISAEQIKHGFQVALIDFWKKQGKKVTQTHTYMEVQE